MNKLLKWKHFLSVWHHKVSMKTFSVKVEGPFHSMILHVVCTVNLLKWMIAQVVLLSAQRMILFMNIWGSSLCLTLSLHCLHHRIDFRLSKHLASLTFPTLVIFFNFCFIANLNQWPHELIIEFLSWDVVVKTWLGVGGRIKMLMYLIISFKKMNCQSWMY